MGKKSIGKANQVKIKHRFIEFSLEKYVGYPQGKRKQYNLKLYHHFQLSNRDK